MIPVRALTQSSSRAGVRKVTYSLPTNLVAELDRRTVETARSKSALVADALALYFVARHREALAAIYAEAARDSAFQADNAAVLRDFAALDAGGLEGQGSGGASRRPADHHPPEV